MPRISLLPLLCGIALALSACASNDEAFGPSAPTAEQQAVTDPSDETLQAAIQKYLADNKAPSFTSYKFARVDLDNDGRRDALVMMDGPHNYWCAMDGCSVMVFKASNTDFTAVSQIFPVRGPMYVSNQSEDGWKKLIIHVSGQEYAKAKDVELAFEGGTYPRNPFFQPEAFDTPEDHGQSLFP